MKSLLLVALLALAGCSVTPIHHSEATDGQIFAYATPGTNTGTVIALRYKYAGRRGMIGDEIYIDGERAALIYGGEKAVLHLPAGKHLFAAVSVRLIGTPFEIDVKPGSCVIYEISDANVMRRMGC